MSLKKFFACAAIVGSLFSLGAAKAADMYIPVKAVAAPVPYVDWTGFYAGLAAGYHTGKITEAGCVGICPNGARVKGLFLLGQAGYDYQFANNVVLGVFAAVPLIPMKATNVNLPPLGTYRTKANFVANFNARLGYAYMNWLPYVFGGVVFANTTVTEPSSLKFSKTYTGYALGFGVEYALSRKWSVDAKYSYIHLPKKTYLFTGALGPEQFGEDSSNFMIGANYHFMR